ncbi:MAG: family 43 glycosylhydrolase, partial [Muribaculaceae bacterium]|nr:family 43 glycosylhydrolase [Muribaculaceae bacterium]
LCAASSMVSCRKSVSEDNVPDTSYLFAYFPANSDENLYYAISDDGFNYNPLNGGRMVMDADSVALKKGIRDPYVTRGKDGKFYMVATDMRSAEGWASNRGIVLMSSDDLINWKHSAIHFPEKFPEWKNVTRVWAPEVIWDENYQNEDGSKGRWMVYFSLLTDDGKCEYDKIFYSYANDDFTDLIIDPVFLYDRGSATIDGDIVYDDKTGLYHLFYKNEGQGGICQVTSTTLTAPEGAEPGSQWSKPSEPLQQTDVAVEGAGVFKLEGTDEWVLMYDCYGTGIYQFCTTEDLENFKLVAHTEKTGDFTPRHGSVISISKEEREKLLEAFPEKPVHGGNPVLTGFFADPEILYSHKTGKFYIYPTTDGTPGWGGHEFNVFSSRNLVDWKKETCILDLATDDVTWATGNAWAPSIEEKYENGEYKYYFFFSGHNPQLDKKTLGMAVSNSPTGPFKDLGQPFVSENITEGQLIDSDVFTDPVSGDTYFYWGNGRLVASRLSKDMRTVMEPRDITPEGGTLDDYAFREGVYVFYRDGKYYFLWSVDDTGSPNYHVAYGTADSPLGPIKVADNPVILSQRPEDGIYGTAHNSVIKLPNRDEWYIVYHRINKDYLENDPGVHREICIDRLEFNEDGTIKPVKPTNEGILPVRM